MTEELKKARKQRKDKRITLRMNMSFEADTEDYLRTMSALTNTSMTQYVNNLVKEDMIKNIRTYSEAVALRSKIK